MKFWKIQLYDDMNFFKRLIYKIRIAKEMKKMCEVQKFLDSNPRDEMDISKYFDEVADDVCEE